MTDAEAFASIALAAVACDGTLGREEAHALRRSLEYRTPYKDRTEQEMGALFDRLLVTLREQGVNQLVTEALPALTPIQQETALAVAVQLTHADRDVSPAEQLFLNQLCERLSLPDGRAVAVMEAITALHRDSLST
ncbi:TerB-like domain containing protein [Synechococcus sp. BIOS-E4-1]|uniref:tellurite resistance TerB family protein n=1 Tax=unclassified Synechococcus TaxID=2626047 RepID=UPI0007BAFCC2|nr:MULTISPECIES: tellurite resistance TerB family protein [unclassified Synechococcus]KZR88037.1 Tellurite resistance protein TerB [Synechococcus sp. MIT S9504]KZR92178.1 Tellurite resistance protein TerB [Synechococcus sp. MIT S9509]QNI54713.1 TerB-like domain containing protein [Synechococcus sp. BIOS-E4-1]